jgi:hypothetical protein
MQDAQFVSHRVLAIRGDAGHMQFVNRLCDSTRQGQPVRTRQHFECT